MTAWTEEHDRLLHLIPELGIAVVAERLGRTVNAVRVRVTVNSLPKEKRAAYQKKSRAKIHDRVFRKDFRKEQPPTVPRNRAQIQNYVAPFVEVPRAMAERERRLSAPARDLTSSIMGDPPVGFSALEKYQRDLVSA